MKKKKNSSPVFSIRSKSALFTIDRGFAQTFVQYWEKSAINIKLMDHRRLDDVKSVFFTKGNIGQTPDGLFEKPHKYSITSYEKEEKLTSATFSVKGFPSIIITILLS